jgi:hypothetical protein
LATESVLTARMEIAEHQNIRTNPLPQVNKQPRSDSYVVGHHQLDYKEEPEKLEKSMKFQSIDDMEKDDAVTKGAARVSKLVLACGLDVRGSMSRSDLAGWLAKLGESKLDAEVSAEDMAPKGSIPVTELVEMLELLATCGDVEAEEKLRCLEQSVGLAPAKRALQSANVWV